MNAAATRWLHGGRPWGPDLVAAAVTMLGVLGSLATTIALQHLPGWTLQEPVLAVVLALTAARVTTAGRRARLEALVELPALALLASAAGWLLVNRPWIGQVLLVLGLTVGIFSRRYSPVVRRAGRLAALPFLALLITPVPVVSGTASDHLWWAPVVAVIALLWSSGCTIAARRWGLLPAAPASDSSTAARAAPPAAARPSPARRRLDAPTRMAIQMAVGLAAAMAVGHGLFGDRWHWTVLSAFLVASGNRGRGDVVHKAGLRVVGALVGTLLPTLLGPGGQELPPGRNSDLVLLFGVMLIALVLRPRNYAFWAAGVTAMVALLHGYLGSGGAADLLRERLIGVFLGSLIGVAAAWFVLPVRTGDVLRRRIADCLAALTDALADGADPAAPQLQQAVARVDELAGTLRAHSRIPFGGNGPRPLRAIAALHELEHLPDRADERRTLRAATVRVRRAMVGRDDPAAADLPPALATVHGVLQELSPPR